MTIGGSDRRWILVAGLMFLAACSGSRVDGTCAVDGDCEGGVCVGGQCIAAQPKAGCTSDDMCPLGETCDVASGTCAKAQIVSCTMDTECPSEQRCNQATGVCVVGARPCTGLTENECPDRYCDVARQVCVECLQAAHCTAPEMCLQNQCIDPMDPPIMPGDCMDDGGCNSPMTICEANECVLGCANPGGIQCIGEEICDTNTGRCVSLEGPCMMDPDCTPPQTICEFGQCIPGCHRMGGLQCQGGEVCNPSTGRCRTGGPICTSDLECNAPNTICNLFAGACEPGCLTTGCTSPEVCNNTTGHCEGVATCTADRFEPNETAATASMINGGVQSGLSICPGDQDYFQIALGANDTADVTLNFVHGEGNLDLQLIAPNGTVVQTSAGTTGTETVSVVAATAGIYTVRVFMAQDLGPTPGNTYTMNISANVAPCPQDSFEDNDQDFGAPLMLPGSYPLNVCVGDEDYFDVILTTGETITVDALFSHAEGDIDIQLLGFLGIPLGASASSNDNESLSYTANNAGLFTIRVALFTDTGTMPGNPYTLNVTISQAPPAMCTADSFEPNNSGAAAASLSSGSHPNLNACTDDDFYSMSFAQGDAVTITASFVDAEGDIDIDLLNPGGTSVASGTSNTDNETITYTVATSGTHQLRVYLYADAGSTPGSAYTLNVSGGGGGGGTCAADTYEPNNTQAAGRPLVSGTFANLTSCDQDDDFYILALSGGTPVTLNATFVDAEGDIDITLLDPNGTVAASSASANDNEQIMYTPTMSGNYALRVFLYRDDGSTPGNNYSLALTF